MTETRRTPTPADIRHLAQISEVAASGKLFNDIGIILWVGGLEKVKRFEGTPMIHRTDLWIHTRRTAYLADVLRQLEQPLTEETLNQQDIFWMGMHHDDGELMRGDIPSPEKRKMSAEEKKALKDEETGAVRFLADFFQHADRDRYVRLFNEASEKQTLSAQIVDLADKLDGLGETIHEIRCGNENFFEPLENYRIIFGEFEGRAFWRKLKLHPWFNLDMVPSRKEVEMIPKISVDDLKNKETAWENMLKGPMPSFYRTWLELTLKVFDIRTEKYLLPGWYMELWRNWGVPANSSTLRGIVTPGLVLPGDFSF
ncbi:MAG: hypothetical protein A2W22_06355 [Candidatus Levybacteria bacterium RBG_16_35_11]|nr:MAG: hypothetical protein A2W22_06355 [Candidatus Levybacteria bacterium RBG_16_35_11]